MPLYDFTCTGAPSHAFEHYLPLDHYKDCPPCPTCGAPTERDWIPQGRNASAFADPIVVYRAPDGSYRFPGATKGRMASHYDSKGFTRVECHNAAEVRQLERSVNQRERSALQRATERRQAKSEEAEHERRQQFHHEMSRMSNFGRDLARAAIDRNNQKRDRCAGSEPGFRVDVLE
jgi:hypothetical protein